MAVNPSIAPISREPGAATVVRSPYTYYTSPPSSVSSNSKYEEYVDEIVESIEEFVTEEYVDPMEYFEGHSLLGSDGGDFITSMYWETFGQETQGEPSLFPASGGLAFIEDLKSQLGDVLPQFLTMTQSEFLSLLTVTQKIDETGEVYHEAAIDLPVPTGYKSIQVRLSEV